MFRLKPLKNEGILLVPCNSIHMFFMFFSIDVVFLDKNNKVVHFKKDARPWTVISPVKNAHKTLELPVKTIHDYSIKVGDTIEYTFA